VDYPTSAQLEETDNIIDTNGYTVQGAFIGGHIYDITDAVASELIAAGYSVVGDPVDTTLFTATFEATF
jgi:hypothetical protein